MKGYLRLGKIWVANKIKKQTEKDTLSEQENKHTSDKPLTIPVPENRCQKTSEK